MQQRRPAPIVTATVNPDLPNVAWDVFRSYQCLFHLRVNKESWIFDSDRGWMLEIEKITLRPGSDGCTGNPLDLQRVDDTARVNAWSKRDNGKWVVIKGGDPRLVGLPGILDAGDGLPQFRVNERVIATNTGGASAELDMNLPFWETVMDHGAIKVDWDAYAVFGRALAKALWGIDGPPERTVRNQLRKTRQLHSQIAATLDGSRSPSRKLKERVERVGKMISEMESYLPGSKPVKPQEQVSQVEPVRQLTLLEQIQALSGEEKDALVGMLTKKKRGRPAKGGASDESVLED